MSEYEQADSFRKNGFVIIPDVITPQEVKQLRDLIYGITQSMPAAKRQLTIADAIGNEKLMEALLTVQFHPKLLAVLRKVIGTKVSYINNLNLQCNMFGLAGGGGWHLDSGSEVDTVSNRYLYDPSYLFGKVGFYLQDNTAEFGGGISVVPGSHKAFKSLNGNGFIQWAYRTLANKLQLLNIRVLNRQLVVPIKAGSAVYFDSRLLHRSTPPAAIALSESDKLANRVANEAMGEAAKYVFYWEACAPQYAQPFLVNAGKRAISEEVGVAHSGKSRSDAFFTEFLSYHYPEDYPQAYVERVNQTDGVAIASVDKRNAEFWKQIRDSFQPG